MNDIIDIPLIDKWPAHDILPPFNQDFGENMYSDEMLKQIRLDQAAEKLKAVTRNNPGWEARVRGHGMKAETFVDLLIQQEFCCGICQISLEATPWIVDHDHFVQLVRGALCPSCNGWMGKNEEKVKHAWVYLKMDRRHV